MSLVFEGQWRHERHQSQGAGFSSCRVHLLATRTDALPRQRFGRLHPRVRLGDEPPELLPHRLQLLRCRRWSRVDRLQLLGEPPRLPPVALDESRAELRFQFLQVLRRAERSTNLQPPNGELSQPRHFCSSRVARLARARSRMASMRSARRSSGAAVALTRRSAAAPARRGFIATNRNGLARKALIRSRIGTHVVPVWYPTGTFRCVYAGVFGYLHQASAANMPRQFGRLGALWASYHRNTIPKNAGIRVAQVTAGTRRVQLRLRGDPTRTL